MKRICTIDVGTNTVNTLVAEVLGSTLSVLADEERFARLGQGVDANGQLSIDAIERVMVALRASMETASRFDASSIVIGGTSASRDAGNVGELQDRVREELGLQFEVLSGEEEARWSAIGALVTLDGVSEAVVIDIGGGSTEIVRVESEGEFTFQTSLDVGTVRLSERHFSSIPPPANDVAAARKVIEKLLESIPAELAQKKVVVATGSTARVVAAMLDEKMHVPLDPEDVYRLTNQLLSLTPVEALAISPGIVKGREDLVAAAGLILSAVLEYLHVDSLIPSVGGLRHGLALRAGAGKPA